MFRFGGFTVYLGVTGVIERTHIMVVLGYRDGPLNSLFTPLTILLTLIILSMNTA